jgi:hypothetical protein
MFIVLKIAREATTGPWRCGGVGADLTFVLPLVPSFWATYVFPPVGGLSRRSARALIQKIRAALGDERPSDAQA